MGIFIHCSLWNCRPIFGWPSKKQKVNYIYIYVPQAHSFPKCLTSKFNEGSKIPKVVSLEVNGELVEGNVIKGQAKVAWCGGTPGKGVAR